MFNSETFARNQQTNQGLPPLGARFNTNNDTSSQNLSQSTFPRSLQKQGQRRSILHLKQFSHKRNVLPNLLRQRKDSQTNSVSQIRHKVGTVSVKRRVLRPSGSLNQRESVMPGLLNNSSSSSEGSISNNNEIPKSAPRRISLKKLAARQVQFKKRGSFQAGRSTVGLLTPIRQPAKLKSNFELIRISREAQTPNTRTGQLKRKIIVLPKSSESTPTPVLGLTPTPLKSILKKAGRKEDPNKTAKSVRFQFPVATFFNSY